MKAVDRFERYGQKIYNGQDVLKNHILNKYPIVKVDNTDHVLIAKKYADQADYIWLVDKSIETLRSFPWWFKPKEEERNAIHQFPYVHKGSKKIINWTSVQLVPTKFETSNFITHKHICAVYDVYCGKENFDIFYVSNSETEEYTKLKNKFNINHVKTLQEAQEQSTTDMLWIVPNDVIVSNIFKFSYRPDDWSLKFTHTFVNGDEEGRDGIILIPKNYTPKEKELKYRYYANKKELNIVASKPMPYNKYYFKTYDEYLNALETSSSELFWWIPDDVDVKSNFDFNLYFTHQNQYDRNINHVFLNDKEYDGVILFSKNSPVSEKEFNHRFLVHKKEHEVVASTPKKFEQFVVNNYADYKLALERSTTKMFYGVPSDVNVNYNFDLYFTHHNQYDRNITHVFKNDKTYDGIVLFSKNVKLTEKEVNYRFYAKKKEWNIVASTPKCFDIFEIDSYEQYLSALENSTTDLFWATSANLKILDLEKLENFYISHHELVDRKQNHSFIHKVNNENYRNGVFLLSKHKLLSKKEIEYRFLAEHKEWDIILSGPVEYNQFNIETYEDYLNALENSKTELFWATTYNVDWKLPDLYFTHDNEYDRKTNHAFKHLVDNKTYYNGIFLLSKHKLLTQKEIEHRHIVDRKEWDIVVSQKTTYDIFEIETYEEYLRALETTNTELFYGTSPNIDCNVFDFDLYFTHDNEYDRKTNHSFIHYVNNVGHRNGLFLFSKYAPVTQKEIEHRFLVNAKEWDIVGSTPKKYEQFYCETYEQYLDALIVSETEMFWVDSPNINTDDFDFDVYFTHDNEYDRKQNHAFVHLVDGQEYYNGLFLCSKYKIVSRKEFEHRFIVDAKRWNIIGSKPANYDVFNVETYDDYITALENADTEMFWGVSNNIEVDETIFDKIYFTHDNEYDRKTNHAFVHLVDGKKYYNGLFLFSKHAHLSSKEIEHRHIINRKEWNIVGSTKKAYDVFEIDNYDEYLNALANSTTEMFWMSSKNITANIPDLYFTHDNTYDRNTNHSFLHCDNKRNGLFLMSKQSVVTEREIEHRFLVNAKEWDIVCSGPIKYEIFTINTYDDYLNALYHCNTEMFWAVTDNVNYSNFDFDVYFTHDNEYDRKQNHSFIHRVDGKDYRNGVFLLSTYKAVTQKEIEHRFLVNAKEWDTVASGPVEYEHFTIDTYDDYLNALENSNTEMFWGKPSDVAKLIYFDYNMLYFTHDNEYDRKTNHVMLNGEYRDGIVLFSKHAPVTQKEIENRFYTNKKDWDIVGSTPKQYNFFNIETYDDYLNALENSNTEMFWASTNNIKIEKDFDLDLYFSYHNSYDRSINHTFIHRVDGEDYYNGLFLLSKRAPLTQKEIEHRLIVKRKEWNIVASGPIEYNKFIIDTYEDYERAVQESRTEMFWMIPPEVNIEPDFKFDLYFTHNQWFERETNHIFKNGTAWDGISLVSKKSLITEREINMRFLANKKEHDVVASNPTPYDIVFISKDEEHADANYAILLKRFPRAKRVHGVEGIHQAHIAAAEQCTTDMIWIVDADAEIVDNFNFDYYVPAYDPDSRKAVHVWKSQNPINGLIYGYGGVKLLPRQLTLDMDTNTPDMTTSISKLFKAVNRISNVTKFNTDEFSTWRSAFRECVKLSSRTIKGQLTEESEFRLNAWCTRGKDKPFGKYCIAGAQAGKAYGTVNKDDIDALRKINNFDWLRNEFDKIKNSL